MKKFLVMFLMLIGLAASAQSDNIFVLPLYMSEQNSNAYSFDTASEIVAEEIIQNFLLGNTIDTTRLDRVKALLANNSTVKEVGVKFNKTGLIDFEKLSKSVTDPSADKLLLVVSFVEDEKGLRLGVWDTLKLASDFQIDYPYVLTTKTVLVDSKEGVAIWQKTYKMPLASNKKPFIAQNYSKAAEQYEKIRSFSKNIIAKDVEQNLSVRLKSRSIDFASNLGKNSNVDEGVGLKYYKKGIPVKITPPAETMEEQLKKDDSFSL